VHRPETEITKAEREVDPTRDEYTTEVAMCNNHDVASVQPFFLVLSVVLPDLIVKVEIIVG